MITYSAPAKIILSGEHGVVYGKPAFVSAIDMRLEFIIHTGKDEFQNIDGVIRVVHEVVTNYLEKQKLSISKKSFSYEINSQIPVGRGMGSSAAFSVAGVAALLHFYTGKEFDRETINQLAYQCEKKFHGNPSGVDNSTSCFGGLIFYRKEFEFLKHLSSLNFKISENIHSHLYLIDTGKPTESTAEMVAQVGKNYNQDPKKMERLFNQMEKITKRMVVAIVKEDPKLFSECIAENETILEEIGIVSDRAEKLIEDLNQFGKGKITGAGGKTDGSGFILFIAQDEDGMKDYLKERNIMYYKFTQDFEGLKIVDRL